MRRLDSLAIWLLIATTTMSSGRITLERTSLLPVKVLSELEKVISELSREAWEREVLSSEDVEILRASAHVLMALVAECREEKQSALSPSLTSRLKRKVWSAVKTRT